MTDTPKFSYNTSVETYNAIPEGGTDIIQIIDKNRGALNISFEKKTFHKIVKRFLTIYFDLEHLDSHSVITSETEFVDFLSAKNKIFFIKHLNEILTKNENNENLKRSLSNFHKKYSVAYGNFASTYFRLTLAKYVKNEELLSLINQSVGFYI